MAAGIIAGGLAAAVIGWPAVLLAALLVSLSWRNETRARILMLGAIASGALLYYDRANLQALFHDLPPLIRTMIQQRTWHPQAWGILLGLWWHTTPAAPILAIVAQQTWPKSFVERLQEREARRIQQRKATLSSLARSSTKAPEVKEQQLVLGVAGDGDAAPFVRKELAVYPPALLNRHAVVIGASGTGKTVLLMRIAALCAKVYGWRVFYLDAKGDYGAAATFLAAMAEAGLDRSQVRAFPRDGYDGWRGTPTEILNRLMAIQSFLEPYYKDITRLMLDLACKAPGGPPRSSAALLERLQLPVLARLYQDLPEYPTVMGIRERDAQGVYARYRALFGALNGKLDGSWAYEDVRAGYLLLDGIALKEEARGIGRYLLEDFGQAMVKRLAPGERVLLVVDEYSALSESSAAEELFERVRSPHGTGGAGMIVTSQSYAGLGEGAERMIAAAATTILFQCADPEHLVARAGTSTHYRTSYSTERTGVFPAVRSSREMIRGDDRPRLDPNLVQTLPVGACYLVPSGAYQLVAVAPLAIQQARIDAFRAWVRGEADDASVFTPATSASSPETIIVTVERDEPQSVETKDVASGTGTASPAVEQGGFSSE